MVWSFSCLPRPCGQIWYLLYSRYIQLPMWSVFCTSGNFFNPIIWQITCLLEAKSLCMLLIFSWFFFFWWARDYFIPCAPSTQLVWFIKSHPWYPWPWKSHKNFKYPLLFSHVTLKDCPNGVNGRKQKEICYMDNFFFPPSCCYV